MNPAEYTIFIIIMEKKIVLKTALSGIQHNTEFENACI